MAQHYTDHGAIQAGEAQTAAGPKGIGLAVAFDWAFASQLAITSILPLVLLAMGQLRQIQPAATFPPLIGTVLFAILGEGVRRGKSWARIIQIIWNSLGFIGGFAALYAALNFSRWLFVPAAILLILAPFIVWRLTRPATATWFKTVTDAEARRRHGGSWPWLILIWSIISGAIVAAAATFAQGGFSS
jgi:hypothetical protein